MSVHISATLQVRPGTPVDAVQHDTSKWLALGHAAVFFSDVSTIYRTIHALTDLARLMSEEKGGAA